MALKKRTMENSRTMETSKLVEEVRGDSTTYELVQERDTKVSEVESEEKNNTEPTTRGSINIYLIHLLKNQAFWNRCRKEKLKHLKMQLEEKRNVDSKPEEISKPVDEVDEKTIIQESTQESPNREVPAEDKYTESSAEEFRESESKLSEGETEEPDRVHN